LGNHEPVNAGERRVLEYLASSRPDSSEVHQNIQIAVENGPLVEYDIVVFGPDLVWMVKTKDPPARYCSASTSK
jgi:hypothetical protein